MAPIGRPAADCHCETELAEAGKVSDMGRADAPNDAHDTTTIASVPAGTSSTVERDLGAWRTFLREEDRRCQELRIPAALVTIGLVREADTEAALRVLTDVLGPTDRIGLLCADELSVLASPLEGIHHAQRVVQRLDAALRGAGIGAHIGWAMRVDGHGLFHAAARADAAMLTARGHGRIELPAD